MGNRIWCILALNISGGNNFNHFAENQLTQFSARDAGDFSDALRERDRVPKCGGVGGAIAKVRHDAPSQTS